MICKVVLQRCIDLADGHSVSGPTLGEGRGSQGKTAYSVLRPHAQLAPSHGACLHARGVSPGRDGKELRNPSRFLPPLLALISLFLLRRSFS